MPQVTSCPANPAFLWKVEGLSVSAGLSQGVLVELRAGLEGTPPDTEFGGILVGSVESEGEGFRTQVDAFIPFPIEYRYNSNYVLSPQDRTLLERRLKRLGRKGLVPVGVCRSHRRRGMYLDQRDFDLFRADFRHPASIFLLVRKGEPGASATGAIFVWEEEDVRRHASYLEFPMGEPSAEMATADPLPTQPHEPALSRLTSLPIAKALSAADFIRHSISPVVAAKVLLTIALPLLSFYTARQIAEHRAHQSELEPVRSTPGPVGQPVQRVFREGDPAALPEQQASAPVQEAVSRPAVLPPRASGPDSRDRTAPVGPVLVPESSTADGGQIPTTSGGADTPMLPEPPAVSEKEPIDSLPRLANSPPSVPTAPARSTAAGRPGEKVIAYFKPAPVSSFRNAIQKVPVIRDLARGNPGEGYVPPNPIDHPLPTPPAKGTQLASGTSVQMLAKVDRHGNVVNVKVVEGNHQLARASTDALLRWRFEPARQNGAPVEGGMLVRFEFQNPSR